jgi:hypothetical protein
MSLDINDAPDQAEIVAVLQNARERLQLWGKRTAYATAALLLSCGVVWLFTTSRPWHAYWRPFGEVFLLAAMALQLVFVYCLGLWMSAWFLLRERKKEYS